MRRFLHFVFALLFTGVVFAQQPQPSLQSAAGGDDSRYDEHDDVLIRTRDGATISAIVVRRKEDRTPLPALLRFDIYTDPAAFRTRARDMADHGYVAVVADTRGKRLSGDPIVPYEHEASDTYEVIDWIAHQPWSDGKVGMLGGSYSGFSAWSATKHLHPALKTIAVSAAVIPGLGLPMEHNVFISANYAWAFYVSDNRLLDNDLYDDRQRWRQLPQTWFESGRPYQDIDAIDGKPNPILHRWLMHPAFDAYWQAMVPYRSDFARIGIPVLTITGYYDDAQISALEYVRQHSRYNPHAQHYVVIGPYDHFGSHAAQKDAVLRDYAIDPAAQFSTPGLTYQWMDYILKDGPRPAMLADRINYEVMGANAWRHADTLDHMSPERMRLYLSHARAEAPGLADGDGHGNGNGNGNDGAYTRFRLQSKHPSRDETIEQSVDLTDRQVQNNAHDYPAPIVQTALTDVTEQVFVTEPLLEPAVVSGAFSGQLRVTINKRDADLGVTVFEQMTDGKLFYLAHWLGRASFAPDSEHRHLLTPGHLSSIPFETTVVSRQLGAGSRLMFLLDINKNAIGEVNYGTGKDVSRESIADAGEPLKIAWHTSSYIDIPIDRRRENVSNR